MIGTRGGSDKVIEVAGFFRCRVVGQVISIPLGVFQVVREAQCGGL